MPSENELSLEAKIDLSDRILQKKAIQFAGIFDIAKFKDSASWVAKFKK
ncbi:4407_t:CDS:2 [Cetraspora pellucida]|uniref:4407_t:CDS:1 n=1 Tax=Cetraspora pellucida TaxID=1433469 RepID=A0ACA9KVG0_9GLOM|nr:4407_t:CDS:2 [Cetraspora pellucida]